MNRAENRAYEAYPKISRISEPHGLIPADNKSHYLGDGNEEKREGFIAGYHQAEKDLTDRARRAIELTTEELTEKICQWIKENANKYIEIKEGALQYKRSLTTDLKKNILK